MFPLLLLITSVTTLSPLAIDRLLLIPSVLSPLDTVAAALPTAAPTNTAATRGSLSRFDLRSDSVGSVSSTS